MSPKNKTCYNKFMKKTTAKKPKKIEVKSEELKNFHFPQFKKTVKARTYAEAVKLINL